MNVRLSSYVPVSLRLPLVVLLIGCGLLALVASKVTGETYDEMDPSHNRTYWTQLFAVHDAETVYALFKERNARLSPDYQHLGAHVMGELMYIARGIDGIAICDGDYNFGCYHGLVSSAIAHNGLEVVRPLDKACSMLGERGYGVCQHGIGHGILEYLGPTNLATALEACTRTDQSGRLAGCLGGVYMEYNVPLVLNEQGKYQVMPRLPDAANPYTPCDTLTTPSFAQACYVELPQWWKHVYPEDYAQFGNLCASIEDVVNRDACRYGIGKIIPSSAYHDVEVSEALCAQVGEGEVYTNCILHASWSFQTNINDRERAVRLCAYVPVDRKGECPT